MSYDATFRHVIENAISGVENLSPFESEAARYLHDDWLPFARDVLAESAAKNTQQESRNDGS